MRQIHKQAEPDAFVRWKAAKDEQIKRMIADGKSGGEIWGLLQGSLSQDIVPDDYSKAMLRECLVIEQFFLCCYCNDALKGGQLDTIIEHFLPKKHYKAEIFNYANLLAACNGGERVKPIELSCGSEKDSNDPTVIAFVSPFDQDAHQHFSYTPRGEIIGKSTEGIETIAFLNLNCKRLQLRREAVIEEYIYDETETIDAQIAEVLAPVDGKLQAFCMAIADVLNGYR